MNPKLFGYWRSSATWRVRWAFHLKGLPYDYVPVNILTGDTQKAEHLARNPLGMLPVMEIAPGRYLSESLAMLEWLEERYPETYRLYPGGADERAVIRSLCEMINSGTAPLQTPRAQKRHSENPDERAAWGAHFTREGLRAFAALRKQAGFASAKFAAGSQVTAADLLLVPQIYNALRFKIDMGRDFPELFAIYEAARATEACRRADPESQVDAQPT